MQVLIVLFMSLLSEAVLAHTICEVSFSLTAFVFNVVLISLLNFELYYLLFLLL